MYVCLQFCRWTSAFYSLQNANINIINHKQFKDSKHEGGTHSDRYTSISVAVIISHRTKEEENTNSYVYIHVHGSVYTQGTTESRGAQRLTVLGC